MKKSDSLDSRLQLLIRILFFSLFNPLLWSCSTFLQRSPESGFRNYNENTPSADSYSASLNPETFRKVAPSRSDLLMTPEDRIQMSQRQRLRQLERALSTRKEREQYAKVIGLLKSDSEKITFLEIPSPEERQIWLQKQGIWNRAQSQISGMKPLVDSQDIAVGMPQDLVRKSWGEPNSIEISGDPLYKNERWKYLRSVTLSDGFKQEKRWVYFESGRVVGWETE